MVEYQKRDVARISGEAEATLKEILSRVTEFSADSGTATGGSQTTCVDSAKNWESDMWKGAVIEIYSIADEIYYLRTVSGNTANTITFAALPAGKAVASGDSYAIRLTIGLVDLDKVGGTALTGRDISLDLAKLGLQRWGRDLEPSWVHATEQTAPGAGTALVTQAVGVGKSGYIYGFLVSAQETNDFKLNWTSGATAYSIRIPFGGAGSTECVDPTPLNEGLPADAGTNITITNVNAATAGKIYQARLLYAEV